jgi:hypothetical protein
MKQTLFLIAIAAYLCSAIYPSAVLDWIVSSVSLLIVVVVFPTATRFVRVTGGIFLAIGFGLLAANKATPADMLLSFGYMLNVLSLFALIPLVAIPIELGRYAARVQAMIRRRVRHSGELYVITSSLSYMFCSFMNLASLPVVHQTIQPSLDLYPIRERDRFISRAITHGYSMPVLWSPIAPIMGIVVEMTGVRWGDILPIVIPLSLFGLLLDCAMGMWIAKHRHKPVDWRIPAEISAEREPDAGLNAGLNTGLNAGQNAGLNAGWKAGQNVGLNTGRNAEHAGLKEAAEGDGAGNPLQILAAIALLNLLISLLERVTHIGFLLLVSLTVIPFAYVWSLLIGKGVPFLKAARIKLPQHLLRMQDTFFVYLSAGFMIAAIKATGTGHLINAGLGMFKDAIGPDLFLLVIPLIPLGLAFAGLHPAVGLALAAESLNPAALGISPQLTAIAMLTGASTAFLMGPYNATAGLMANLINRSPYKVSNWNAPFTAVYLILSMFLLLILKKGG